MGMTGRENTRGSAAFLFASLRRRSEIDFTREAMP